MLGGQDGVVNAISPGPFPSPKVKDALPEFIDRLDAKVPMGRMGLARGTQGRGRAVGGGAGSYITGQNILVDGGWTAW
ncbi:MAG: SDR family oxidoreductase [Caldilineaceae bacterium]